MDARKNISRRRIFKTGLASLATVAVSTPKVHAETVIMLGDRAYKMDYNKYKKANGETKVVYLGGEAVHNGAMQRQSIRRTFRKTGWRLMCTEDARFVKPELLQDTDLFILTRFIGNAEGWSPDPIVEGEPTWDGFMSDELEEAIIDNVKNRGMGLMALHCTGGPRKTFRPRFNEFMGIKNIPHGPQQPVQLHSFNQDHPVTKGVKDFRFKLDENFGAELINKNAVVLYRTIGLIDDRHDIAGWSLEQGKGRIIGLRAGHSPEVWRHTIYTELHWRAAHWAMKRDIPPFEV